MGLHKDQAQIKLMRKAGKVVAEMHSATRAAAKPGVTTGQLDLVAREVLDRRGATSNFLGYRMGSAGKPAYPGVICASPNEVVVHGIPGDYVLQDGDLLSVDCGAIVDGWHADAAYSMVVGDSDPESQKLIDIADASLDAAITQMKEGNRLTDIGHAVEVVARKAGYGVVDGYGGHAIGTAMHEEPTVPNVGPPGRGPKLRTGYVFAIEPMLIMSGVDDTYELEDEWTVVTADGSRAAHVEHTIAITDEGPWIITAP